MARQRHRIPATTESDDEASLFQCLRPWVRHCGDAHRPAWYIGKRRLLDFLLVGVGQGRGRFRLGQQTFPVQTGDLFWIPPDTEHELWGDPPGMQVPYLHFDLRYDPARSHWDFSIPGGCLDLSEHAALMHPPLAEPRLQALAGRIRHPGGQRVISLMRTLCAEAARGGAWSSLRLSGLLLQILAEILRLDESDGQVHLLELEYTAAFMREHCHRDLRMQALAQRAGLSPSHFREQFQRHFACSPREYIRQARINYAKDLMLTGGGSLTIIAGACGFASVHAFSRAFRAVVGIPPSDWLRFGHAGVRVEGRWHPLHGSDQG